MKTFIRDSFRELSTNLRYIFFYYCLVALFLASLSSYLEIHGVSYLIILAIVVILIVPLHFVVFGIRRVFTVSQVGQISHTGPSLLSQDQSDVRLLAYRIFPTNVEPSSSESEATQVYLTGGCRPEVPDSTSVEAVLFDKALTRSVRRGGDVAVLSRTRETLAKVQSAVNRSAEITLFRTTDARWPFEINPVRLAEGEGLEFKVRQNMLIFEWMLVGLDPRAQELFRQALCAVTTAGNATLSDVARLIDWREVNFRRELARDLESRGHSRTATYWTDVYPGLPTEIYEPLAMTLRELLSSKAIQSFVCTTNRDPDASPFTITNRITVFDLDDPSVSTSLLLGQLLLVAFQRWLTRQPSAMFSLYADQFWSCSVESLFVEPIAKLNGFGHRTAGAN